jgi:hypothetical protein
MAAIVREIGGCELMGPQRLDTAINERPHHIWVGPPRPGLGPALTCRKVRDVAQRMFVWIRAIDRAGEQRAAEIRPRI